MFKKILVLLLSLFSMAALAAEKNPPAEEVEEISESYWYEP